MPSTPVLLIGSGMIAHDQILPALLQMRREGAIGEVSVCSLHNRSVIRLASAPMIRRAFPDVGFTPVTEPEAEPDAAHSGLYRKALADLPPYSVAVVAVPDQHHHPIVLDALRARQHVCCVKPLALRVDHALEIEREAAKRGLLVGIEYHKRFDPRSMMARDHYRRGRFGEFRLGTARLMEKWHYRESNFQNWFTADATDSFVYVGCHYVDLVHFITGLTPSAVSVHGILDTLPNGKEGYLWTDAASALGERRLSERPELAQFSGCRAGPEHPGHDPLLQWRRTRGHDRPLGPIPRNRITASEKRRPGRGFRSTPSRVPTTFSTRIVAARAWCRPAMGCGRFVTLWKRLCAWSANRPACRSAAKSCAGSRVRESLPLPRTAATTKPCARPHGCRF